MEREPLRRAGKLQAIADFVIQRMDQYDDDDSFRWDLLGVLIDIQNELDDPDSVRETIQWQQQEVMDVLGAAQYQKWMGEEVARRWNRRDFDIAIWHLEASIPARTDSAVAARNAMMIGDILVQKAFPSGPYDEAIEQYGRLAQDYGRVLPDLAADAKLRQARTLWRNGQQRDAEAIAAMLQESGNEPIVEGARHFARLMKTMSGVDTQLRQ